MKENLLGAVRNILILFICLGMVGAGMIKVVGLPEVVTSFEEWGLPTWTRYAIGVFELIIGTAILIPASRQVALGLLMIEMLGASTIHAIHGQLWDLRGPILVILGSGILFLIPSWLHRKKPNQQT